MKIAILALAPIALAPLAFATTATAAENPFARDQVVLQIKDLDLATVDGQQRLAIRMDDAARAVCGDRLGNVHLAAEAKARECRTAVTADIRSRIEARTANAVDPAKVQLASAR